MQLLRGLVVATLAVAALAAKAATVVADATNPAPALSDSTTNLVLVVIPAIGFAFAMYWWYLAAEISIDDKNKYRDNDHLTAEILASVSVISRRVSDGATTFLFAEYKAILLFLSLFGTMLYFLLGVSLSSPQNGEKAPDAPWVNAFLSLISLAVGAGTSVLSGWIGMRIAVYTNSRTAIMATTGAAEGDSAQGFAAGFQTAFRGGITMGFTLTSLGIFSLYLTVKVVGNYFGSDPSNAQQLYECVAAFGLGGSAVACFGRVGGGIFTKAADVGSDLVGKVEKNIPEDDARTRV
jgi:inorganic pyrophosphatase